MDDRDAFAMAAMAAMIGNPGKDTYGKAAVKAFPVFAYEWADAMLAVRGDCDEIARLRAEVEALKAELARLTPMMRLEPTGWEFLDWIEPDFLTSIPQGTQLYMIDAARAAQGERG